jgi:hypothetical protein
MRAFCKNQRGPISRPCDNPLGAFRIRNRIDDRDVSGKVKKRVFRISRKSFGKSATPTQPQAGARSGAGITVASLG